MVCYIAHRCRGRASWTGALVAGGGGSRARASQLSVTRCAAPLWSGSGSGSSGSSRRRVRGLATAAAALPEPAGLSPVARAALFLPCAITFGLGVWQVYRLDWKYTQIADRQRLLAAPPVDVGGSHTLRENWAQYAPSKGGTEFTLVQMAGVYDHEHEVYIGMRGKPGSKAEEERGAGYSVVTPLDIGGGGGSEAFRVYVNRGWVSAASVQPPRSGRDGGRQRVPSDGGGGQQVAVLAVVRRGETGAWYLPSTEGQGRSMTWIDLHTIDRMCGGAAGTQAAGSAARGDDERVPLLFDAVSIGSASPSHDQDSGVASSPERRPLDSYGNFPVTPFKHQIYASTWFCLSGCIGLMYFSRIFRRSRAKAGVPKLKVAPPRP